MLHFQVQSLNTKEALAMKFYPVLNTLAPFMLVVPCLLRVIKVIQGIKAVNNLALGVKNLRSKTSDTC